MHSRTVLFGTIILFGLTTVFPAASQNREDRGQAPQPRPVPNQPRPGGVPSDRPQSGRPNSGGSSNRPQPSRPNSGVDNNRPGRPNPGSGNNRPQPGQPNPGNGRPQPNRPNPGNNRPQPNRPNGSRPPQWGHRPAHRPSYSFRRNDRSYLYRYYRSRLGRINRINRPRFVIGGFFPYTYIPYLSPLPPDVYAYLPPPPPGYAMGYYDGYVVVYDPVTYFIVNVIDLLQ